MNTNTQNTVETTVAPVAHTQQTQGNDMNTNTNTPTETTPAATKRYKMTPTELYMEAVEKTVDSKKSAAQISASGNEFQGLNKAILNEAKAELGFKSNKWYSAKAMQDNNLVQKSEDDYGVILFSSKLKDIDGLNKTLPKDVELEPVDPGIVLETSKVKITIGINTSPKKRTFEHIKVKTLVSPPSENFYLLDPPDVKVLLEGREQIIETTMPKDITAYVDLENATAGYSLLIKVIPPANCNVISVMPSTVTVKDNILQGTK